MEKLVTLMQRLMILLLAGFTLVVVLVVFLVVSSSLDRDAPLWSVEGADPQQGRRAVTARGCHACHVIPGIREATGRVGPKLEEIDRQIYLGGVLTNSPENMMAWIQEPRRYSPRSAMPDLGVSPEEARDITAYLFRNP